VKRDSHPNVLQNQLALIRFHFQQGLVNHHCRIFLGAQLGRRLAQGGRGPWPMA
jgi:hypothetical protein